MKTKLTFDLDENGIKELTNKAKNHFKPSTDLHNFVVLDFYKKNMITPLQSLCYLFKDFKFEIYVTTGYPYLNQRLLELLPKEKRLRGNKLVFKVSFKMPSVYQKSGFDCYEMIGSSDRHYRIRALTTSKNNEVIAGDSYLDRLQMYFFQSADTIMYFPYKFFELFISFYTYEFLRKRQNSILSFYRDYAREGINLTYAADENFQKDACANYYYNVPLHEISDSPYDIFVDYFTQDKLKKMYLSAINSKQIAKNTLKEGIDKIISAAKEVKYNERKQN